MLQSKWISPILVVIWIALQGIATIWPTLSKKTIPTWLSERGWLPVNDVTWLWWASLLVGIAIVLLLTYQIIRSTQQEKDEVDVWSTTLEQVSGNTFLNESVVIDGKAFMNCKFVNATLVYEGRGLASFVNVKFEGSIALKSTSKPANAFSSIVEMVRKLPNNKILRSGTIDDKGNFTEYPPITVPLKSKPDESSDNVNR